jgi:ATP-dependent RNA helicase HelY
LTVAVAGGTELSAGDFVRWCRQVIDLLDQVGGVAQGAVGLSARSAVGALRRGVVAMGSV